MSSYTKAIKNMTIEKAKDIMVSSGLDTATMMWINSQLDQLPELQQQVKTLQAQVKALLDAVPSAKVETE